MVLILENPIKQPKAQDKNFKTGKTTQPLEAQEKSQKKFKTGKQLNQCRQENTQKEPPHETREKPFVKGKKKKESLARRKTNHKRRQKDKNFLLSKKEEFQGQLYNSAETAKQGQLVNHKLTSEIDKNKEKEK